MSKLLRLALASALTVSFALPFTALAPIATAVAAEKKADKKGEKVIDINSASPEELMTLDGIGEARSKAIIKGRPYRAKDELVDKNIIPEGVYAKIKDQIIAHQSKKK